MELAHPNNERYNTVVIGAGQAGLSVGYHLKKRNIPFIILEAHPRVGDSWRQRWDSLRLFTPSRFDGLDGMSFPGPSNYFPTKDEMADFLELYARQFGLPVQTGVTVERLSRTNSHFLVRSNRGMLEADNVVVAMASYQQPNIPDYARKLNQDIVQLHSSEYRTPSQLREGALLIVGAGNSGAEIAIEVAKTHRTWMSGRDVGYLPFRIGSVVAQLLLAPLTFRLIFHRLLTLDTPIGRRARSKLLSQGGPLIRQRAKDLAAAGVKRVARVVGVEGGKPLLADGRVLDVANIIWCTGFHPGFSWIELPVHGTEEPLHNRGIVRTQPGLFFVGLHFLYAFSSTMIHGVGRDAEYVAGAIASRQKTNGQ
jgi:putative flavoprotein involved in K+ transport